MLRLRLTKPQARAICTRMQLHVRNLVWLRLITKQSRLKALGSSSKCFQEAVSVNDRSSFFVMSRNLRVMKIVVVDINSNTIRRAFATEAKDRQPSRHAGLDLVY